MTTPPPFFKLSPKLQLRGALGFFDGSVAQLGGQFLTNEQLLRKKCAEDLQVVKVPPPSVPRKQL